MTTLITCPAPNCRGVIEAVVPATLTVERDDNGSVIVGVVGFEVDYDTRTSLDFRCSNGHSPAVDADVRAAVEKFCDNPDLLRPA